MRGSVSGDVQSLVDQTFGRLRVLKDSGKRRGGNVRWICVCICGKRKTIAGADLKRGRVKSCGCLSSDTARALHTTHGASQTALYEIWMNMHRRCRDPRREQWKNYGGRGITVCVRWTGPKGFARFATDMGARPSRVHTLERKNNDKGYSPHNCVWATPLTQSRNRRQTRLLTYRGKTQCMLDWARELRVPFTTIANRLLRGWSVAKTLSTPRRSKLCSRG